MGSGEWRMEALPDPSSRRKPGSMVDAYRCRRPTLALPWAPAFAEVTKRVWAAE